MSNEPLDTAAMRMRWNDVEYWREMYSHVIFGQAQPDILALANEVDDLRRLVSVPAPTPTVPVEVAETIADALQRAQTHDLIAVMHDDMPRDEYRRKADSYDAALKWLAQAKGATE